ncbi:MAG: cyclic nucleotide-binding domain-containing protein [Verrucomicrobiales bacterium]|nr:cyclic nucleotide-binding domain-containing protein [Verrucomicrobiales bacterium]
MKEFAYIHDEENVPDTLLRVPFLETFNKSQLDDILNSSSIVECEPGDTIVADGEEASRIFILLAGRVNVEKNGKVLVSMDHTGDIFGEFAALSDERRTASVVADTTAVCLAVDQKFLEYAKPKKDNPEFYAALYEFIAKLTAKRLKATSEALARMDKELRELKAAANAD